MQSPGRSGFCVYMLRHSPKPPFSPSPMEEGEKRSNCFSEEHSGLGSLAKEALRVLLSLLRCLGCTEMLCMFVYIKMFIFFYLD